MSLQEPKMAKKFNWKKTEEKKTIIQPVTKVDLTTNPKNVT